MSEAPSETRLRPFLAGLYWTIPAFLSLLLYYRGLWCWFQGDDFSLLLLVSLPDHEFWPALWQPRAQGTLRPLSERLFFYYFYHWFGLDAFPYWLLVFATHVVNLRHIVSKGDTARRGPVGCTRLDRPAGHARVRAARPGARSVGPVARAIRVLLGTDYST